MMYQEALPIAGGALLGGLARFAYHRTHRWTYVAAAVILAVCATVASGEFRQSWGFLVDDLLFVAAAACVTFAVGGLFLRTRQTSKE